MARAIPRPKRPLEIAAAPQRPVLVFRDFVRQLEKLAQKPARPKPEGAR